MVKSAAKFLGPCLFALACGGAVGEGGVGGTGGVGGAFNPGGGQAGGRAGSSAGGATGVLASRAGVAITLSSALGQCPLPPGPITVPPSPTTQPDLINDALSCDLSDPSCKPDSYVVVNGQDGAVVTCSVSPTDSGTFHVDLQVDTVRLVFSASGRVAETGGDGVQMTVYEQRSSLTVGTDATPCTLTIQSNQGTIKAGAVWARFSCSALAVSNDSSHATCKASGQFIFEDCAG